jgi:hypothetical protein
VGGKEIAHMKLTSLSLTLVVVVLASGCDDGSPDPSTLGCTAAHTTPASPDGVISAFSVPGGGVKSEVIVGPATAAPSFTADGTLHITVNTPALSTAQLLLVDFPFPKWRRRVGLHRRSVLDQRFDLGVHLRAGDPGQRARARRRAGVRAGSYGTGPQEAPRTPRP